MNVYDFDGTIYDGDSTKDFFLFCLKRHPSLCLVVPRFMLFTFLYMIGKCGKEKMKESFYRFLTLLPDTQFEVRLFWDANFNKIKQWYLFNRKDNDIVISASPDFLLRPICSKLNVYLIASLVNPENGMYTGKNCYGIEKVRRFKEMLPDTDIELFYSDSESDRPLAELSQRAYFVKNNEITEWRYQI